MTESGPPPARGRGILPLAVLLAITAIVYTPSLSDEFVYDDYRFVPDNIAIRSLDNPLRFFTDIRTLTATQGDPGWDDIYRPLRTLHFAIDWAVFGKHARGFRLVNLGWHLVAVGLGWILLRRITRNTTVATTGAALFALHPLQVQSVAWISSRGDLMAAVFVLGAALLLFHEHPGPRRTVPAVGLYGLALLSKESAISLLALVVVYDLLLTGRPRLRWKLLLALGAITGAFLAVRFSVATAQLPWTPNTLLGAGSATFILLGETLFPVRLIPYTGDVLFQDRIRIPAGGVLLFAFAALSATLLLRGRRTPRLGFGVLWAVVCLAPVSNLMPLKSVAESRFAYLPLLGVGLLLGLLADRSTRMRRAAVVALLLLGAAAASECRNWREDVGFWEAAVRKGADYRRDQGPSVHRGGDIALSNLGVAYAATATRLDSPERERYLHMSLEHLRESARIRPTASTLSAIALTHLDLGDRDQAVSAWSTAIRLEPRDVTARQNLGRILCEDGRYEEAEKVLGPTVVLSPEHWVSRAWLGAALLGLGRDREARAHLETCNDQARAQGRDDGWVLLYLGHARRRMDDFEGAVAAYEHSSRLLTEDPLPYLGLARVHLDRGNAAAAIRVAQRGCEIAPNFPPLVAERLAAVILAGDTLTQLERETLLTNLDKMLSNRDQHAVAVLTRRPWILAVKDFQIHLRLIRALLDLRNLREAERRLLDMRKIWPEEPEVLANLGIVLLNLGRPAEAVPLLESAARSDPGSFILQMMLARAYRATGRDDDATRTARTASASAGTEAQRSEARLFLAERRR